MKVSEHIRCVEYPCIDVKHESFVIPDIDQNPDDVSMIMISEAAPADTADYYYAGDDALFARTTVQAF